MYRFSDLGGDIVEQESLLMRLAANPLFPQILSMIEEAAGTRLYESKKVSAQKTIVKKESKLQEIQTVTKQKKLCTNCL